MNGAQTVSVDPVWWVVAIFVSVFINIGIMTYFLYTKLEKAEAFLYDVNFIRWYKSTFGSSLIGRQARMNAVSMVVMVPSVLQKRGAMSREAYLRLPPSLIKQIRALYIYLYANGIAMITIYVLVF
jgi:hypothetical protein